MHHLEARRRLLLRAVIAPCAITCLLMTLLVACTPGPGENSARHAAPTRTAPGSAALGPTDPARVINISLVLAGQNQAVLAQTLAAIDDPASPSYHHYLTPAEYAQRFGASAAAVTTVEAALGAAGLRVTGVAPNRLAVYARGTVGQVETLFGVRLRDYRGAGGAPYFKPDAPPHIPAALQGSAAGVLGLNSMRVPAIHSALGFTRTQAARASGMSPQNLANAYNLTPLHQAGLDGSGQSIALAEIDRFKQSDINTYDRAYGISAPTVAVVTVDGGTTSFSPEPVLDIEVIQAVAPKVHIITYEVASSDSSVQSIATMFARIVSDNRAPVVSISLGACEPALDQSWFTTIDQTFQQAAAQGMSVLSASGDNGAYDCGDQNLAVDSPSSDPFVTAVGGTSLFLNTNGGYDFEAGWEGPLAGSGGGGGLSVVYARPNWQTGAGVLNGSSNGARQVPDVAADADVLTGYRVYYSGPGGCSGGDCWQVVGGTSGAAPLWAALIVLANQDRAASHKASVGYLNPTLYRLAAGASGTPPFHDVVFGGNLFYQAASGWDYSTGLGTPDGAALVAELAKA